MNIGKHSRHWHIKQNFRETLHSWSCFTVSTRIIGRLMEKSYRQITIFFCLQGNINSYNSKISNMLLTYWYIYIYVSIFRSKSDRLLQTHYDHKADGIENASLPSTWRTLLFQYTCWFWGFKKALCNSKSHHNFLEMRNQQHINSSHFVTKASGIPCQRYHSSCSVLYNFQCKIVQNYTWINFG